MIRFQSNILRSWSAIWIAILIVVAILSPLLQNSNPIICKEGNSFSLPFLKSNPISTDCDWKLDAPIPYSASYLDRKNMNFKGPFDQQNLGGRSRHLLGTDRLGRDTLAGLIMGCRFALIVGFFSLLLAGLIGLTLGAIAGYFGDEGLRKSRAAFIRSGLAILPGLLWFFHISFEINLLYGLIALVIVSIIFYLISYPVELIPSLKKRRTIPADQLIMRLIEIFDSIPKILIILVVLALVKDRSIWHVVLLLGLFNWPTIARVTRGEVLKVKSLDYISASKLFGFSDVYTLVRHVLPNALPPLLVILAFTASEAILYEATLSFLGIGASEMEITWAQMLAMARQNYSAWWLVTFPGILLFLTLYALNHLADQYDQRHRRRELNF